MERWEIVERCVLVAVGIALLGVGAWLAFFRIGPERFVALVLLAPCVYWVFWQAFFEDRLSSAEPPSTAERAMWTFWLWSRRLTLGLIAMLFALAAIGLLLNGILGGAAILFLLAFVSASVAAYGGGRHQSMSDDRAVHRERMKRYK